MMCAYVQPFLHNPLQLPILTATPSGFTAVILSYDRVQSLFTIIQQLAACPSLVKVLVVWNNQVKAPPPGQWVMSFASACSSMNYLQFFIVN
jgi:hypothetical protein